MQTWPVTHANLAGHACKPGRSTIGDSEALVHDVEADQSVLAVVEGLGHSGQDLEPERLPQCYGGRVRLHDSVELHAVVAGRARPLDDVLSESSTDTATMMSRVDHEARRGYVCPAPRAV